MAQSGDVEIETPIGTFRIELYWQHAPKTCKNFFELAKKGTFHCDNNCVCW